MSVGLGTAIGYLKLDVSGFARGVDSAISDMNRMNGQFSTASQGLQTIGGMFSKTGAALTAGLTAPVVGFGAASVKAGTDFDASISQVSAVSKATGKDLQTIRDRAIEMGEKTRYSAKECSDAMYYMGLAGWDAQQIYAGIPGVLALGAASGENLSRVSDIVTDSLTAFGKSAEDTTEFVNVLAEASRSSNTTVDMLGESFKYVGPVAGAFGYSIQDVAIALGIFANSGVKGSQAGTGLRQALNALINPSDKAAAEMDKYGVSLFNADGSTKDLMTVMKELRGTFGSVTLNGEKVNDFINDLGLNLDTAEGEAAAAEAVMKEFGHQLPVNDMEKLSAVVKIFGVRALPGMLSVINASDESFDSLTNAIYGAQDAYDGLGTAFGMQETMLDNLQGDWYLFTSALGTTKILISDMAKGALRDLVQKLTELVNKFNEMSPEQREQIVKWAMMAASIGPVLVAIGKLISGIGSLITTFNTIKGAFTFVSTGIKHVGEAFSLARAGMTGFASQTSVLGTALGSITAPIAAVIAIIAVLIAAFVNLWKNNEEFRNKIIGVWENIKATFEAAGQKIVDALNQVGFNFENIQEVISACVEAIKVVWNGLCEFLAPIFVAAFQIIGNAIEGLINLFAGVIEVICGIIKGFKDGDWSLFWQGLQDVVMAFVNGIIGIFDILGEMIWNLVQTVANWFGVDWNMTWDEAKQAVADWFDSVVQWVSDLVGKIADFFSNIWNTITTVCTNIWNTIKTIWNSIVTTITTILQNIVTGVQNAWTNITTAISNFMQLIWNTIQTVWNTISTAVSTVLNIIWTTVSNVFNTIWTTIQNVMQSIWDCISTVWETIRSTVETVVNTIWETIKSVFYNIALSITEIILGIKETITSIWNAIKSFLQGNVDEAKNYITNAWNMIKTTLSAVMENIRNIFNTVWNAIKTIITTITNAIYMVISTVWNTIKTVLSTILTAIQNIMSTVWNAIKNTITTITNAIHTVISTVWNTIKTVLSTILTAIQNTMNTVWNAIKNTITTIVNAISTFLSNTWNTIKTTISSIVNAIKQTISDVFNAIKTTITNITNAIQTLLTNVWNNIKTTISNVVNNIKTVVVNTFNNIKTSLTNIVNGLYTTISNVFNNIKTAMSNAVDTAKTLVINAMTNAKNGVINVWNGITDTFAGIGKNIIQGIINGIGSMVSSLYESIKSALSGLVDKAKSALGISSPSKVMRDKIGKWLPPGIAQGFMGAMPKAISDIEDSLNDGINDIEADSVDVGGINVENPVMDFVNSYQQAFEGLVIWFETMEERMAIAVESLAEYFRYLMYVRQIIGNDDDFRAFVLGGDKDDKPKKPTGPDTPNMPVTGGGDTFIFQSPKAIDELQAARLLKTTKRDLAEGF